MTQHQQQKSDHLTEKGISVEATPDATLININDIMQNGSETIKVVITESTVSEICTTNAKVTKLPAPKSSERKRPYDQAPRGFRVEAKETPVRRESLSDEIAKKCTQSFMTKLINYSNIYNGRAETES